VSLAPRPHKFLREKEVLGAAWCRDSFAGNHQAVNPRDLMLMLNQEERYASARKLSLHCATASLQAKDYVSITEENGSVTVGAWPSHANNRPFWLDARE
jgi:hypothetical protein